MAKPKPKEPYARIGLRVPRQLKEGLERVAKGKGISVNQRIIDIIKMRSGPSVEEKRKFRQNLKYALKNHEIIKIIKGL